MILKSSAKSLLAALMLLATACASSSATMAPLTATPQGAYRLGAGDEVRITVFGLDAASNTYVVGDAGTIAVPLLPTMTAAGQTADELQAALVEAIKTRELLRNPSVSVQVQKYRPFFILGEVQRPGQYPYVPGMSVLTAVSIAGGYTFRADTKKAAILRPSGGSVSKGGAKPDTLVQPGDTVNIPEAWF